MAGFTLVEVIVVLLILSVSAAAVAPIMARPGDSLDTATEQTSRLLNDARRLAVSRGIRVRLTLEPGGEFRVRQFEGDTLSILNEGRLELPDGVSLGSDKMLTLTFDPRGGAWGDSVALQGEDRTRRLAPNRWTGEERVSDDH